MASVRVPYSKEDDYADEIIRQRQELAAQYLGEPFQHVNRYSFDPHVCRGNIESFIGVAQVPIGLAGPILIHGEHAQGEFLIPLATSEGTLVASYNRGMKALTMAGRPLYGDGRPDAACAGLHFPERPRCPRFC